MLRIWRPQKHPTSEPTPTGWRSVASALASIGPRKPFPAAAHRKPFQKAVDAFDLDGFIEAVEYTGADYVLFTSAHALQMLPAPHPVLDRILPGRTCKRDLIGELADALAAKGKHLLVYYNHSCNHQQDSAWERAVGYHAPNKERFARNIMDIVGHMGERYKEKIKAWWFDSPYSLDPRGPHNSVTTDMTGFQFPWEQFTGSPSRPSCSARDLQRRCQSDVPVHDTPRLLGWGDGQSRHPSEGSLRR